MNIGEVATILDKRETYKLAEERLAKMIKEDRILMYEHAALKWLYIIDYIIDHEQINTAILYDIHHDLPELRHYPYCCSMCNIYRILECKGCPMVYADKACSQYPSLYQDFIRSIQNRYIEDNYSKTLIYAKDIYYNIMDGIDNENLTLADKYYRFECSEDGK